VTPEDIPKKLFLNVFQGFFQYGCMNIRGHVDRALTVKWVPCRRVSRAEKLDLESETGQCFFNGKPFDLFSGIPGGAAGRPF
jgi:hypothetical protein